MKDNKKISYTELSPEDMARKTPAITKGKQTAPQVKKDKRFMPVSDKNDTATQDMNKTKTSKEPIKPNSKSTSFSNTDMKTKTPAIISKTHKNETAKADDKPKEEIKTAEKTKTKAKTKKVKDKKTKPNKTKIKLPKWFSWKIILVAAVVVAIILVLFFILKDDGKNNETSQGNTPEVNFSENWLPVDEKYKEFDYIVTAENNSKKDYYVRIDLATGMEDKEEEAKWLKEHLNSSWEMKGDFFYYDKPLASGETSEPLLLDVKTNDSFLLKEYDVPVYISESGYVKTSGHDSAINAFK